MPTAPGSELRSVEGDLDHVRRCPICLPLLQHYLLSLVDAFGPGADADQQVHLTIGASYLLSQLHRDGLLTIPA